MISIEPSKKITLQGFFVEYDEFNRVKLMFLDDRSDCSSDKLTFTKSYMLNKEAVEIGNAPINGDYFYVKSKNSIGIILEKKQDKIIQKMVPITDLLQHTVECVVVKKRYKFHKDGKFIQGWTLNAISIRLIEL